MPKMKTHSGAAKRFRKTKNHIKAAKAGRRHLLTKKSRLKKRNMRRGLLVNSRDIRHVKSLLHS
jgi:large subunit ribosomal protein L35